MDEWLWIKNTLCPRSGGEMPGIFCRHRESCILPTIGVRALNQKEAGEFILEAAEKGGIPQCKNGKDLLLKPRNFEHSPLCPQPHRRPRESWGDDIIE